MIADLATSQGAMIAHAALGTEARSVTNPLPTVIVLSFTATPTNSKHLNSVSSKSVVYDNGSSIIHFLGGLYSATIFCENFPITLLRSF